MVPGEFVPEQSEADLCGAQIVHEILSVLEFLLQRFFVGFFHAISRICLIWILWGSWILRSAAALICASSATAPSSATTSALAFSHSATHDHMAQSLQREDHGVATRPLLLPELDVLQQTTQEVFLSKQDFFVFRVVRVLDQFVDSHYALHETTALFFHFSLHYTRLLQLLLEVAPQLRVQRLLKSRSLLFCRFNYNNNGLR